MTELTSLPAPAGSQLRALKVHAFDGTAPFADYAVPLNDIIASSAVGYFPEATAQVPKGLAVDTDSALNPGSGGADGVFDATWSGGNFTVNPKARFKVRNGRVDWFKFDGPGLCVNASPSAPTVSLSASTGLTGASVPFTVIALVESGATWWGDHASDATLWQLYRNNAGAAAALSARTEPKNVADALADEVAAAEAAQAGAEAARDIAQAAVGVDYADATAALAGAANGDKFTYWAGDQIVFSTKTGGALVELAGPWIGADWVGYGQTTVQGALNQVVYLKKHGLNKAGLLAALAEQQATGAVLMLPPGNVTIAGWDTPFAATEPLFMAAQGMDVSTLTFTGATASFIHQLDPVLSLADFTIKGLTANSSGNGGGAVYALAADVIGSAVAPKFHRVRFDGCKAPINIEVPFDGAEIRDCEYINGSGHGFRFGHTTGAAAWGTWKNLSVLGWKVRNLVTTGPGQNVYAGLAYGEGHRFDGFDIDGITGTMDRNGNAWPTEAGGLHFQARNVWVGANNISRNITGAEVLRGCMVKGEISATNCTVELWTAYCGGAGTALAWYAKSGSARVFADDPGVAAVEIGSSLTLTKAHIHVDAQGTNRAGVYAVSAAWDSGHLKITGTVDGFVKPIAVTGSTGAKTLLIDMAPTGGNGNAIDVYLSSSVEEIDIAGRAAVANNGNCRWVRGASSAATVNKLTMRGALTVVGGFGTVLDTVTINSIDHEQHVSGVTTPGRELTGTAIIKAGRLKTNIGGTTTNATALNALSFAVPNGKAVTVKVDANGTDGTDDYQIGRDHGFGAAAGAAALRASFPRLVGRSGGAGTWDAAAIASGANAVVQFTGAAGKTITHRGFAELYFAG